MAGEKDYISIDRALQQTRVPLANHTFIKGFLHGIGIAGVYVAGNLIVADRQDGGRSLNIGRGSTNGFASEEEVIRVVGEGARREVSGVGRGWRVIHPEDPGGRESGPLSGRTAPRDAGQCELCFSPMAPSGFCTNAMCDNAG